MTVRFSFFVTLFEDYRINEDQTINPNNLSARNEAVKNLFNASQREKPFCKFRTSIHSSIV